MAGPMGKMPFIGAGLVTEPMCCVFICFLIVCFVSWMSEEIIGSL